MNLIVRNNLIYISLLAILLICLMQCTDNRTKPTIPEIHPDSWMNYSSDDFHASIVLSSGSAGCKHCHGDDLDGGKVDVSCIDCHAERTDICISCHGGLDNNNGAPPYGLKGEVSDTTRAVGAHTSHLDSIGLSGHLNCNDCHIVPAFTFDLYHFDSITSIGSVITDSITEIVWGGIAGGGTAIWNRDEQSCTNTYCHGAFDGGYQSNQPIWNQENQAECGSCHDIGTEPANLQWKHEYHIVTAGLDCDACHADIVDSTLNIINLDMHINGSIEISISDSIICQNCHGNGPIACTGCHGGIDNTTGAPPYGLKDETLTSQLAVGAHTAHLDGNALSDGIDCSECHLVPAGLTDSGHLDGDNIAELKWSPFAGSSSSWDRTTSACTNTYCHGNFNGGYSSNSPNWTGTSQTNCGTCHDVGTNPENLSGMHKKHFADKNIPCRNCHNLTQGRYLTIIGPQYHIDGEKTVNFSFSGNYSNGTCSGLPNGCHGTENWYD